MKKENEKNEMELSEAIYRTFNSDHGKSVLAWILDQCGFFETDPQKIKPELITLGNRILSEGQMAITGDMGLYMDAVMKSYAGPEVKMKTVTVKGGQVVE